MMSDLEKVVKAFDEWRRDRVSKNQPTPDRLWAMVKELTPHYKKVVIQRALRISGSQFNERAMGSTSKRNVLLAKERNGFAVGTIDRIPGGDVSKVCEISLQGARRSVALKVGLQELPYLMAVLDGYL